LRVVDSLSIESCIPPRVHSHDRPLFSGPKPAAQTAPPGYPQIGSLR
jgi:hypothetical protein